MLQIRGKTNCCRDHVRKGIRHVFCLDQFKEKNCHKTPGDKKLCAGIAVREPVLRFQHLQQLPDFLLQHSCPSCQGQCKGPGCAAQQEDQQIIIPDILPGMLGNSCPQQVMHAKELQQEIAVMEHDHGTVPEGTDGRIKQQTAAKLHPFQSSQITAPGEEEEKAESRQGKTYGALRQCCQGCACIGCIAPPGPAFRIGKPERHKSEGQEQKECHVRDDGPGDIEEFDARCQDETCRESPSGPIEAVDEPVGQLHAQHPADGLGHTGGKFTDPDEFIRKDQLPVIEDGFVIPVMVKNTG